MIAITQRCVPILAMQMYWTNVANPPDCGMFGAVKDCCVDREVKLRKATIEGAGGICWRLPSSALNLNV
jgi:hypothetical protein